MWRSYHSGDGTNGKTEYNFLHDSAEWHKHKYIMIEQDNHFVSYEKMYTLVDAKLSDVKDSMQRLENKFDTLEAGRLSALERQFSNLQGRMAVVAGVIAIIISVATTILGKIL